MSQHGVLSESTITESPRQLTPQTQTPEERLEQLLYTQLGARPSNWAKRLDWRFCRWLITQLDCGSANYALFRCLSCHGLLSGRYACKCGGRRLSPAVGSTWSAFRVWLRERGESR